MLLAIPSDLHFAEKNPALISKALNYAADKYYYPILQTWKQKGQNIFLQGQEFMYFVS